MFLEPLKKSTLPERGRTTQKGRAPRQEHVGLICGIRDLDAPADGQLQARSEFFQCDAGSATDDSWPSI